MRSSVIPPWMSMSFEDGPGSQPPARSHLLHFLPLVPDKDSGIDSGSSTSTPLCSFTCTVLHTCNPNSLAKGEPIKKKKACFASGYLYPSSSGLLRGGEPCKVTTPPSRAYVRVIGVTWRLIGREATSRLPTCLSAGSTIKGCLIESSRVGYPKGSQAAGLDLTSLLLLFSNLPTTATL
jgi:hypothetical protein